MKLNRKPCSYTRISQKFSSKHKGIDLVNVKGTPVYATYDGTVVAASYGAWDSSYGNMVAIKHSWGYTNHAHLSKINVKNGAKVKAGTKIGEIGSTGNSTGNHLHFEVHIPNKWYRKNPENYFPSDSINYTVGKTYTLSVNLNVRKSASTSSAKLTKKELTANAQKNATASGVLKKGTKVTCKETKKDGSDIWMRIPSGWVAAYYDGKRYVS